MIPIFPEATCFDEKDQRIADASKKVLGCLAGMNLDGGDDYQEAIHSAYLSLGTIDNPDPCVAFTEDPQSTKSVFETTADPLESRHAGKYFGDRE